MLVSSFPRRDNKKLYSYVAAEESAVSIHNCTLILKTVYRLAVDEYQKTLKGVERESAIMEFSI